MDAVSQVIAENLPAILLMVTGFILVVVEIYIPGFGLPGILGLVCLVAGVILKAKSAAEGLILAVIIIALLCIVLSISIHSVSKGKFSRSKFVLNETSVNEEEEPAGNDLAYYIGHEGTAVTILRPAGTGEFDGVKLSVVSEGEFIKAGEKITVRKVDGNRIVVAKL